MLVVAVRVIRICSLTSMLAICRASHQIGIRINHEGLDDNASGEQSSPDEPHIVGMGRDDDRDVDLGPIVHRQLVDLLCSLSRIL